MSVVAYPLNNTDYTAEDAMIFNCTRTSGVFANTDHFAIEVSGDREITITTGVAWMNYAKLKGIAVAIKSDIALSVAISDATLARIDSVVLGFKAAENAASLYIKQGTPSSSPSRPSLTKNESVYELGLYDILIPAGSTTVTVSNITDTREESARCGIMGSGLTDLDKFATMEYVDQTIGDIAAAMSAVTSSLNAL